MEEYTVKAEKSLTYEDEYTFTICYKDTENEVWNSGADENRFFTSPEDAVMAGKELLAIWEERKRR